MTYHLHLGVAQLFVIFVGAVLLMGTAWRLLSAWLLSLQSPFANALGAGMAFMY